MYSKKRVWIIILMARWKRFVNACETSYNISHVFNLHSYITPIYLSFFSLEIQQLGSDGRVYWKAGDDHVLREYWKNKETDKLQLIV